jgi:glycosyltransferase involved in cell wall biosynthesis
MEKNKKIKRYYIMPEVWVTVTQSQVFNWVKLVNENGISTDCISITKSKNNVESVNIIEESIGGKFIEIKNYKTLIINDIYLSYILIKFYFKNLNKYDKIIFQTRMAQIGLTFAFLKWLPKTKFIFEARAAKNEEIKHTTSENKITTKLKIKKYFSELSEKIIVTKSNKVFCVSHALKTYYLKKYNLSSEHFCVFPGAADSHLFYYDEDLRKNTRNELNLIDKEILIVYTGRLEMKWEIPDKILIFFKNLHRQDKRFRLLLVTPDFEIANDLISINSLNEITFVRKVELKQVNKYLNAADVGMLLREDITMNNVASPTKFAEYLMAGLPVIISKAVQDFANNIEKTNYGSVVTGLEDISKSEYEKLIGSLKIDRVEISNWGLKNLSKEAFIKKYITTLQKV